MTNRKRSGFWPVCVQLTSGFGYKRSSELDITTIKARLCNVYRPPGAVGRVFCDQLADVFDELLLCGRRFVVCGDYCPGAGDNQLDTSLVDVLQRYNLLQHVRDATHDGGNTLYLLLTSNDDAALLSRVTVHPTCFGDHYMVACQLHQPQNVPTAVRYQFRDLP